MLFGVPPRHGRLLPTNRFIFSCRTLFGDSSAADTSSPDWRNKDKMEMTSTPNNNITDYYSDDYSEEYDYKVDLAKLMQSLDIMSLIVYCLAFVLGVLGNGVVIWVTGFKMKKTVNTIWFLNLAVADFLFTAFLPLIVTYTALDFHWPFGNFMCKFNSALTNLNIFASVYILVVISVDRCVSVVWPVWAQNHRNVRKASCVSLGVWVLALILSAPYFIFKDTATSFYNKDIINCYTNYALSDDYESLSVNQLRRFRHKVMAITRFLLGFVVPFTVIVSCYAVIVHRLRRSRTLASQSSRSFKIIAAVIATFFLCWAPYHIMGLIEMVNHTAVHPSETLHHVTTIGVPIATSLAFLNSCLNPLLYVFMGQDFKDKVRKSILNVLENAFQEEVSRSYTYTNSVVTIRSKDKWGQQGDNKDDESCVINNNDHAINCLPDRNKDVTNNSACLKWPRTWLKTKTMSYDISDTEV